MYHSQVMQPPIANDCLKIKIDGYAESQLITKLLLQVSAFVFELNLILGMWIWHTFYCWPIILSASVLGILTKCSPTQTTTPLLTTLPPPFLIENQHTILIFIKLSNNLLLFSLYFCRSLNLIFNILSSFWWRDSNTGQVDDFHEMIQLVYTSLRFLKLTKEKYLKPWLYVKGLWTFARVVIY